MSDNPPAVKSQTFKVGARVRYRYGHKDTGTIETACGFGGDWRVRWDNDPYGPRLLPAYECNLELFDGSDRSAG